MYLPFCLFTYTNRGTADFFIRIGKQKGVHHELLFLLTPYELPDAARGGPARRCV
jgi:hypothetical protein